MVHVNDLGFVFLKGVKRPEMHPRLAVIRLQSNCLLMRTYRFVKEEQFLIGQSETVPIGSGVRFQDVYKRQP